MKIEIFFHFFVISNDFKDQSCPLKQCAHPSLSWWMPLFPHGLSKCFDLIRKHHKKNEMKAQMFAFIIRLFMLVVEVYPKWIPNASSNSNFDALFCIICWRTLVERRWRRDVNNIDAKILLQMFTNQGRSMVMLKLCYRVHKLKKKSGAVIKPNIHNDLVNFHFSQDLKLVNVFLTLHCALGRIPHYILSYITFHMWILSFCIDF
jgi:hypothetical protein